MSKNYNSKEVREILGINQTLTNLELLISYSNLSDRDFNISEVYGEIDLCLGKIKKFPELYQASIKSLEEIKINLNDILGNSTISLNIPEEKDFAPYVNEDIPF